MPVNMLENYICTTPPNCANRSSNMKVFYSHSLARPILSYLFIFVNYIGFYRRVEKSVYFVDMRFLFIIFCELEQKHNHCNRPVIRQR